MTDDAMRVRASRDIHLLGGRRNGPATTRKGRLGVLVSAYTEKVPYSMPLRRSIVRWDDDPEHLWNEPTEALEFLL